MATGGYCAPPRKKHLINFVLKNNEIAPSVWPGLTKNGGKLTEGEKVFRHMARIWLLRAIF